MFQLRTIVAIATLAFALSAHPTSSLTAQTVASAPAKSAPAPAQIDINTATAAQLKAFPGIGDAYAARIIAGRPYTAKTQLVSRGVLPQATYNKIQAQIIAKQVK